MTEPLTPAEEHLALAEGGESTFAEFFTRSRHRLKQMLRYKVDPRLRARADLSDILQESYIEAQKRLEHYLQKPEMSFYVWLRQVTLQQLIDTHRKHLLASKRDVKNEVSLPPRSPVGMTSSVALARHFVSQFASPSQIAIRDEMMAQVEQSLEAMEPIDREVLALRHFEEMANREVAESLGLSEAAASNRYVRALARLRRDLEAVPDFFDQA